MEHQKNLLIIDPSASMRLLVSRIAEDSGWQPIAVADLPEADVMLGQKEFQAITTATQLASANYLQVLAHFRDRPELEFTPICLITGDNVDAFVDDALAAGITEIFSKAHLSQFQIYLDGFRTGEASKSVPQGLRALILDDEGSVGIYIAEVLRSLGLQTTLAQRIDAALGQALETRFDLVVADLVLKDGESGNQFIRLLRAAQSPSSGARIIAVSGYSDAARRQEALRSGADAYLPKPFSPEELQAKVLRLLLPQDMDTAGSTAAERSNRFNLSQRERMICAMVMAGHPDKYIAKHLAISFWTVRAHIGRIFRKCGVGNRVELSNLLRFANPASATTTRSDDSGSPVVTGAEAQSAIIDWLSLASHVVDGMQQGILVLDRNRDVVYVNPPFSSITGFSANEMVGKPSIPLLAERNVEARMEKIFDEIEDNGSWRGTLWSARKNGDSFLANVAIRRMPPGMPMGAVYAVEFADVTTEHRVFEEVSYNALHDALTGLSNRVLLKNRGEQEIFRAQRSKRSFAVLYLDLDRFKHINDSDGHAYGDQALVEVSQRLAALLRKSDTLARVGGDEFVALIADLNTPQEAEAVAHKLIAALSDPIKIENKQFDVGASVGISLFPHDGEDFDELVKFADQAMYQAKDRGGNTAHRYAYVPPGRGAAAPKKRV